MVEHRLKRDITLCSFLKAKLFGLTVLVAELVDKEERLSFEKGNGKSNCIALPRKQRGATRFVFRRVITVIITNYSVPVQMVLPKGTAIWVFVFRIENLTL